MRPAISLAPETGTTRFQSDDDINEDLSPDISYHESLGCVRSDYERQDVAKPKPVPTAQVSWSDARPMGDRLKDASDLAFRMEALRRGYEIAGKILDGRHYPSAKTIHKKQSQRGNTK
jgi:hypothetical protein